MSKSQQENEVYLLVQRWLSKTVTYHKEAIDSLGAKDTAALQRSVREELRRLSDGYMEGKLFFDEHGRYVDMGSGRGYSFGQRTNRGRFDMESGRRGRIRERKPKKWYGKVFYGRLNDLQGAIGYKLMEQAISSVKEELITA
jgi:hypothetical protein